MKIDIVTGPFAGIPPYSIGAVEKVWYSLGIEWLQQGHDICFISKSTQKNVDSQQYIYVKGYARTGSWIKDFILDFIYSYKALRKAPRADIIVLNTIWSPVLYVFFKKKFQGALYNVARFPKKQMGLYKSMGCLACVSTPVYNALVKQSPCVSKLACVIPNPIDTRVFCVNENLCLSKVELTVIYAGRVHEEKGVTLLHDKGYNIRLKILGAHSIDEGGSGTEYLNFLNSLTHDWSIEWIEPIYDPEMLARELNIGGIFCYPSVAEKGETFGVAPLEAMGLGLVPVVSDLDCFKDFIEHEVNGLSFNHRVPEAYILLANCIEKLVNSRILYTRLSREAVKTSKLYSVSSIADKYLSVFKQMVGNETIAVEK